ncbi:hypothetical protein [Haloparvum sedimenti]|uniref:hypothetical protein n=1 Tax=Haloparvum sedimenti TaxID=1678448 RepID=UPI00159ED217|nr:hypothetical protein [Haloparvum sedimenti]
MLDALAGSLLHVGTEHPDALWIAAVGVATFAAGLGAGLLARGRRDDATADARAES